MGFYQRMNIDNLNHLRYTAFMKRKMNVHAVILVSFLLLGTGAASVFAGAYKGTDGKIIGNVSTYWTEETTNGIVSTISFRIDEIVPGQGFISRHQNQWNYIKSTDKNLKGYESHGGKDLMLKIYISSTNTDRFVVGDWFPTDKKNFNGRKEKIEKADVITLETSKGTEKMQVYIITPQGKK
jgi:hypothetical protein